MNTYNGKLTSSPIIQDSSSYIAFLERKISILEEIVMTSHVIAELSEDVISNRSFQGLSVNNNCSDVGVQTDSSDMSELEFDSIQGVPHSYFLTDSNGIVELSESMLSIDANMNKLDNGTVYQEITDQFSDNYSLISSASSTSCLVTDSPSIHPVTNIQGNIPVEMIDDTPFKKFSVETLMSELETTHKFSNRRAVYFGEFDYLYGSTHHKSKEVPRDSYLSLICSYLEVVIPDYEFNSVLINVYNDGNEYIPPHSDNEDCIEDDSYIVTISLGAVRSLQFTDIESGNIVDVIKPGHGDVFFMSKVSQSLYTHELLPDPLVSDQRVSLTFRLIKPQVPPRSPVKHQAGHLYLRGKEQYPGPDLSQTVRSTSFNDVSGESESGYVPYKDLTFPYKPNTASQSRNFSGPTYTNGTQHVDTLFISSSMFRELDPLKLSSEVQSSQVLFYPGANSWQMYQRLKEDPKFLSINRKSVKRVFILTGTNYVDSISSGSLNIEDAKIEIDNFCFKLWELFPTAKFNIINILARESKLKNQIVNELNYFIQCMCGAHGLRFIDTERRIRLFTLYNGVRNNKYFRNRYDDVHLNQAGISKLAKHLKYLAHNC